jgi:hypothetical protein
MWRLILANFRYRLPSIFVAAAIAIALALVVNLVLPPLGAAPPPEDDFKLFYFYPVFLLLAVLLNEFSSIVRDGRELRLVSHALLPVRKAQVGAARVLTPICVILFALLLAELLMLVVQVVTNTPLAPWRFLFLTFFAAEFMIVVQFPILIHEVRDAFERTPWVRFVFASVVLLIVGLISLRVLVNYVEVNPTIASVLIDFLTLNPESLPSNLMLHGIAWLMAGANFVLFMNRRSLTA